MDTIVLVLDKHESAVTALNSSLRQEVFLRCKKLSVIFSIPWKSALLAVGVAFLVVSWKARWQELMCGWRVSNVVSLRSSHGRV